METLIKYLLDIIKNILDKVAIIQDEESIKYNSLLHKSVELSKIFNKLRRDNKKIKIAICANNSIEWIISFLSILFSGNIPVLISPSLGLAKIVYILIKSSTSILITDIVDSKLIEKFRGTIMYIHSDNFKIKSTKSIILEEVYEEILSNLISTNDGKKRKLLIYTPNRLKGVKISYKNIYILLKELNDRKIFKQNQFYLAYPEFTYNYVLGLLLPLISGTKIIILSFYHNFENVHSIQYNSIKYKPSTIILNANQFNKLYDFYIQIIPYTYKEYLKSLILIRYKLYSLKKIIIRERLYKLFPGIEKLIILNSSLGLYMEKLLKEIKFPYTVTYGTIETCGIATYSHPNEYKIESVGKPIINGLIEKDNIIYYQNRDNIESLNDFGTKDTNGNLYFIARTSDYNTQSRKIAEILRNIPFIEDCVVYKVPTLNIKDPCLLVNIDCEKAEKANFTDKKEIEKIITEFIKKASISISKVIIWPSKFQRDTYGNIVNVQL